jgi:hypothetical protein
LTQHPHGLTNLDAQGAQASGEFHIEMQGVDAGGLARV